MKDFQEKFRDASIFAKGVFLGIPGAVMLFGFLPTFFNDSTLVEKLVAALGTGVCAGFIGMMALTFSK